jgi:lysophospholipase L1-like esterase
MNDPDTPVKCSVVEAGCQTSDEDHAFKKHCFRSCTTICKYNGGNPKPRRAKCEWVRCCLCTHWFHPECVSLPLDESVGFWVCPSCRNVAEDVSFLRDTISSLQRDILQLIKTNNDLKQGQESIHQLLLTQNNQTAHDQGAESEDEDEEDEETEPSGTLVLGDSIIRNIKATNDDVKVSSISGAKFCDVKKLLKSINPRKEKYCDMFIICGTNDLSTKKAVDKIARECTTVLQLAKQRATNVHLSSILPRNDGKVQTAKIDAMNQLLITVTNQHDVVFINNDKNFLYRDNSVDTTLLSSDGLHLSGLGTGRLLSNLGLQEKAENHLETGNVHKTT